MFDWLQESMGPESEISARAIAIRMSLAFVLGVGVALLHAAFRAGEANRRHGLGATMVLMTILVALAIYIIGSSPARAFGLVGALSIIRFRTRISDTRDTCFVIFAVAMGMAVGAHEAYYRVAWVALPVVGVACLFIRLFGRPPASPGRLKLRLDSGTDADSLLRPLMEKEIGRYSLERSAGPNKSGAAAVTYRIWLRNGSDPAALVDGLRSKKGVQRASWTVR